MRIALRAPVRTPVIELYEATGLEPLGARLERLRNKAIARFIDRPGIAKLERLRALVAPGL